MKIRDLLAVESIDLNGKVTGKNEALDAMVALMAKSGKINDVEKYRKGVYAREEEGTTGIGEGIAIPHCKSDAVSRPGLAAMVTYIRVVIFLDNMRHHNRKCNVRIIHRLQPHNGIVFFFFLFVINQCKMIEIRKTDHTFL